MSGRRVPRVGVIGAGMSGICIAAKLRASGVDDIVIYEKADQVGGTWLANTYPGLACDVPSRYYSYTFAPNPNWSRVFSPGSEIHAYLRKVVTDLDLERHIRFNTEVAEAQWTAAGTWLVRTTDGAEDTFDFLVSATGVLHHPRTPDIPGLPDFSGALFHSARWDHSVPLDGQRVAVVGSGSTGVQITKALAPRVAQFKLFQRTPHWVFPVPDPRYSRLTRGLLASFPALNKRWGHRSYKMWQGFLEATFGQAAIRPGWQRAALGTVCKLYLHRVRDRMLRERMRPADAPLCKRMIFAGGFYERFDSGQAELVDTSIDRITERGIRTVDGREHDVDVIVLATGFHAHSYLHPIELTGLDGLRLSEVWDGEPRGYRTVALPGFPNFFLLLGPHSPIGNQSLFMVTETQVDYVLQWIEHWRDGMFDSAAPTEAAAERFQDQLRRALPNTVWSSGCKSWYLGKDGLPALWPFAPQAHRDMLATPVLAEWTLART